MTSRQVTSKETKGPVSLCENIADMCVPFEIVSNGYARCYEPGVTRKN